MTLIRKALKTAAIGAALLSSTSALAQWQGTWDTGHGEIKLRQNQIPRWISRGTAWDGDWLTVQAGGVDSEIRLLP